MVFTELKNIFLDPETTFMVSKALLKYQEVLFEKPEVTTFLPEVKVAFTDPETSGNSGNFKTGSEEYDPKPNCHVPKLHF